ncbi:MAG: hypothetical protein HY006_00245 [Candidatus Sungbacteria bacterium]|nr:hypothetical protein [Candidatus Sungbacteria bacterium]
MMPNDTKAQLIRKTELKLRLAGLATLAAFCVVVYYILHQWYLIWWG